ncbi:MAG: DNA mismatch endonuclease Vsr [Bacteroidota bacterium]|nr:DNA mismatch endonuclease Vsr [Bacteroidota bacterium]
MTDVHDRATRSYNMSRIRGTHTKPELLVRSHLHRAGFRFTLHSRKLPGKPDIVLPKYKTVIFVQGCFWHGHTGCRYFVVPKTRTQWWVDKISHNQSNDLKAAKQLRTLGWRVLFLWECRLKPPKRMATLQKLVTTLRNS